MQCKSVTALPAAENLTFEIKFDGYRCIALHPLQASGLIRDTNPASGRARGVELRTSMEEEFVIGGYIPGARGFDALLVGVYEKKELIFVATVKDGFVPRIRDELFPALKALQIVQCPFKNLPEKRASRWENR